MKVVFDTDKGIVKVGSKVFGVDLADDKKSKVLLFMKDFINENTMLDHYELDSLWMSYRYCIGRHTIASHSRASQIGKRCYSRMQDSSKEFTAYDINNEIINELAFENLSWSFPQTCIHKVEVSAIDMCCEFFKEYNIESKDDLLKYKKIIIKKYDNDRGYTFETYTWDEYICEKSAPIIRKYYENEELSNLVIDNILYDWKNNVIQFPDDINNDLKSIQDLRPNPEYFFLSNTFNHLLVWNNLVNLFNIQNHHKSILKDGTEVEWYWTYNESYDTDENGNRKEIAYKKIRIPVYHDNQFIWEGNMYRFIPDDSIEKDLY